MNEQDKTLPQKLSPQAQQRKNNRERPIFYTLPNARGKEVSLWLNPAPVKGAPDVDGTIDHEPVVLYKRSSETTGKFLAIYRAALNADKQRDLLGTLNVVVNARGAVRAVINLKSSGYKEELWPRVAKAASDELLAEFGLKLDRLAERRAILTASAPAKSVLPGAQEKPSNFSAQGGIDKDAPGNVST